jgi:hypothetical protein
LKALLIRYRGEYFAVVILLSLFVAVLAAGGGCAARPIHPGSANKFDSDSYDGVLVAHSVIETTKTDLANNAFPASIAGNVKVALNGLIAAYDIAQKALTDYHNAALAGAATTAQSTALTNALADVNTKTAALTSAKAAK